MKLKLEILKETDVNQTYLEWFLDNKVTYYSNNQCHSFSIEAQKKYVNSFLAIKDINLFGIFD